MSEKKTTKNRLIDWINNIFADDYTRQKYWCQKQEQGITNSVFEFNYDLFNQFLVNALSLIENEEYKLLELSLPSSELLINRPFYRTKKPDEERFYLITSSKNMDIIDQAITSKEIEDKDDIEKILNSEKYIILIRENSIFDLNHLTQLLLEGVFEKVPNLPEIIKQLMGYRMDFPNLSEEQTFFDLLQEIKGKYPLSIVDARTRALDKNKDEKHN